MFELSSGIVGSKLPVNTFLQFISCWSPWYKQRSKRGQIGYPVVRNALTTESGKFDLSNIQPTPMFWSVMHLKPFGKPLAYRGGNVAYSEAMLWVFRLSMTKTTFSASVYCSVSSQSIYFAKSWRVLCSCALIYLQPDKGSVKRKMYAVPLRIYW